MKVYVVWISWDDGEADAYGIYSTSEKALAALEEAEKKDVGDKRYMTEYELDEDVW